MNVKEFHFLIKDRIFYMILRFDKMSDMLPQEKARLAAEFLKAAKRKQKSSMKIRDSAKKESFMRN